VGIVSAGIAMFVMLYYNLVLGVPAGLVGTALAVALIFDGISDPLVGFASDKFRSRWGRRHPFMYFAILPVSLLVYLLWNPPHETLDPQGMFIYLVSVVVPLRLLLTFFDVPSTALIPELTADYDERTRLANYRAAASWTSLGLLAVVLYGYWLRNTPEFPNGLLNVAGYEEMGMVSAVAVLTVMIISSVGLHRLIPRFHRPPSHHEWSIGGTLRGLRDTFTEPVLLPLLLGNIMIATAFTTYGAVQAYLHVYFWGLSTAQISVISGIWVLGVMAGFAATPLVSRGRDKRNVAMCMLTVEGIVEIVPYALRLLDLFPSPENPFYFPLILGYIFLDMALYIVLIAMMASMMADVAEKRELASGQREEGTIFSAQSLVGKASGALGVWIAGWILELIDFPTGNSVIEVSDQAARDLALSCIIVFLTFYPIALIFLSRFRIDRAAHESDLEQLEQRIEGAKTPATNSRAEPLDRA
jgi:GPH family glycoside/pentoside/hexuronide:cation symporter